MKKYEAVIILNPNLSSKANDFIKDFKKLLEANTFKIIKQEDVGRRQLSYSINNHNKGHYLLFNIEGDPSKLIEIENKIKYNESIIRHLFISVKIHSGEDSQLLLDSKNNNNEPEEVIEKQEKVKQPEKDKKEISNTEEDLKPEVSDSKDDDNSEEKDDKDE
tara:strand:+ start:264 stop:749 length:486 start_codon:yes stop_codon:yes gene_type:complete